MSQENSEFSTSFAGHIRAATMEDYDMLCALFAELDEVHRIARPDIFVAPQGPRRERAYIEAQIGGEASAIFVAEQGAVLGFAHVLLKESPALPFRPAKTYADIDNFVVASTHRRKGIGTRLLREAQSWARERGFDAVHIGVFAFNRDAISLYERAGFKVDTLRMSKKIG